MTIEGATRKAIEAVWRIESARLTDRLEALVRERKAFDKARRRALGRLREGLGLQWTPPKSGDELHER